VTVATALNLPADWWADTRGKRGLNPKTGKPLGGGSFPLNDVGQCVTAPWYGIKFRPADVPQGEGTVTISLPELGALVGFPRDYPWTYIPTRTGAKGTRNIAQMIADGVSVFNGAAFSAAVQGDDWYEPTAAYQAKLYRLDGTLQKRAALPAALSSAPRPAQEPAPSPWHPLAAAPRELIAWH
jgi:hypothetical protein